jgi:hypothetical protein
MLVVTTQQDAAKWKDRTGVNQAFQGASGRYPWAIHSQTHWFHERTPLHMVLDRVSEGARVPIQLAAAAPAELRDVLVTAKWCGEVRLPGALEFILDQSGLCCAFDGTALVVQPLDNVGIGSD